MINELLKYFISKKYSLNKIKYVLRLLYKYTQLEEKKLDFFCDGNIINLSNKLLEEYSELRNTGGYNSDDGTIVSCYSGKLYIDMNKRYNFLYYLLKCKYSHNVAISILDYYSKKTNLDKDKLEAYLNTKNWKETANKMEYSIDGKMKSSFNFINDVII